MRKMTGFLMAIFTFSLGVSIYFIFLSLALDKSKPLVEPVEYSSLPLISLCDATRNPRLFENDNIRVRIHLSGWDGYGYFVSEPKGDCRAKITFWLAEKSKAEADRLFEQLTTRHSKDLTAIIFAEVEVVGEFMDYRDSGVRRFELKAKEIKQLSPVRQLTLIEYHSDERR